MIHPAATVRTMSATICVQRIPTYSWLGVLWRMYSSNVLRSIAFESLSSAEANAPLPGYGPSNIRVDVLGRDVLRPGARPARRSDVARVTLSRMNGMAEEPAKAIPSFMKATASYSSRRTPTSSEDAASGRGIDAAALFARAKSPGAGFVTAIKGKGTAIPRAASPMRGQPGSAAFSNGLAPRPVYGEVVQQPDHLDDSWGATPSMPRTRKCHNAVHSTCDGFRAPHSRFAFLAERMKILRPGPS